MLLKHARGPLLDTLDLVSYTELGDIKTKAPA